MRLKKIISGGQTGADRAALDSALKFNIDHGGWVPAGRLAEDGKLPDIYRVQEMATASYEDRTKQNVITADGTVIIVRGASMGGTLLTEKIAQTCNVPWCRLDLLTMDEFEGALLLHEFFDESDGAIATLNVAGPRAGEDPFIYRSVKAILEAFLFLEMTRSDTWTLPSVAGLDFESSVVEALFPSSSFSSKSGSDSLGMECKTPQDVVQLLASRLPFRICSIIANLEDERIGMLYFTLRDLLTQWLGMDMGNHGLLAACRNAPEWPIRATMDNEDAVMFILKSLQRYLRHDYRIRSVK